MTEADQNTWNRSVCCDRGGRRTNCYKPTTAAAVATRNHWQPNRRVATNACAPGTRESVTYTQRKIWILKNKQYQHTEIKMLEESVFSISLFFASKLLFSPTFFSHCSLYTLNYLGSFFYYSLSINYVFFHLVRRYCIFFFGFW